MDDSMNTRASLFWKRALSNLKDADGYSRFASPKPMTRRLWRELKKKGEFSHPYSDDETIARRVRYFLGEEGVGGKAPFAFYTAFEPVKRKWFTYEDGDIETRLEDFGLESGDFINMSLDFINQALEILVEENDNKYVRLCAQRLIEAFDSQFIDYHLTPDAYAVLVEEFGFSENVISSLLVTPDTTTYIINENTWGGIVLLPVAWLKKAISSPLQALARILATASNVRDDLNRELRGSIFLTSRELGQAFEVQNSDKCFIRAGALQAELLNQAYRIDQTQYHIGPNLSPDLYEIKRRYPSGTDSYYWLFYDDPPAPIGRRVIEPEPDEPPPWGVIS